MTLNHFKIAWRNLRQHKAYSLTNIFGLTLGIASCLVIFLVVRYELGFDRFNTKADRIYRVTLNALDFNPSVSMAVAPAMRHDFPELEAVSQVLYNRSALVQVGDAKYDEKGLLFADQYFTSVFDYQWLEGNSKTALAGPNAIVLTQTLARKYFGTADPMGKVILLNKSSSLKVTGVIADIPGNTHLPFHYLVSLSTIQSEVNDLESNFWAIAGGAFTYIVLPEHYPVARIQNRIPGFIKKNWANNVGTDVRLPLQPLTDIHFDQRYLDNSISSTTSRESYYALAAVAFLIILIACINFVNLATAQGINRAKEVGIRKVLGSSRSQLINQFLGEITLMVVSAVILALILDFLALPSLAKWLGIQIRADQLFQPSLIIGLPLLTLFIICVAGVYPAFIQSAWKPSQSFKPRPSMDAGGFTLRRSLVVIQFAICQIMIVGTLVIARQMNFFENQDLGFDKQAVISFFIPDQSKNDVLRQELYATPGVRQVSLSSGAPVYSDNFTSFSAPESGLTKDDVTELKFVDVPYIDMFKLKMLAGEKVRKTYTTPNDTVYNAVVNQTMIHKLGITDPQKSIGKRILLNGNWQITITGVVADFQSESKHKKIRPCVMIYRPDAFYRASVKLKQAGMKGTIASIGKTWSALFPQELFSYEFLDDHIAAWYSQEQKEYTAFRLFALIAILISCLGLYGLIAFATAQRVKEVGIRKILGASVSQILLLFSRELAALIAIAFALAAPLAFYAMHGWLSSFAYQISLGSGTFLIALFITLFIAACTISYQVIRAAISNPVTSLRYE